MQNIITIKPKKDCGRCSGAGLITIYKVKQKTKEDIVCECVLNQLTDEQKKKPFNVDTDQRCVEIIDEKEKE